MLGYNKTEVSFCLLLVTLRYKFRSVFLMRSALQVLCIILHLNPDLPTFCSSLLLESMGIFAASANGGSKTV